MYLGNGVYEGLLLPIYICGYAREGNQMPRTEAGRVRTELHISTRVVRT